MYVLHVIHFHKQKYFWKKGITFHKSMQIFALNLFCRKTWNDEMISDWKFLMCTYTVKNIGKFSYNILGNFS